jgi:MFS family permease
LATELGIPQELQIWPASVFSLVAGAVLLPFSRVADVWGSYRVFVCGLFWFAIWSLVSGFSRNYVMLIICRAFQGLGPAAFLPSGITLLGSTYRPGPRKNLVFSLYGALSPVGFFAGIFCGGISAEYLSWSWYFWIGAIVLFVVAPMALLAAPSEPAQIESVGMDWLGIFTVVPGLLLVVFAITDSSHTQHGWATPQIYLSFTIGIVFLGAAFYTQGWVAKEPLLPFDLFKVKSMVPLLISLFFSFGVFGIYLLYSSF